MREALSEALALPTGLIVFAYGCIISLLIGVVAALGGILFTVVVPKRIGHGWLRFSLGPVGGGLGAAVTYFGLFSSASPRFHSFLVLVVIAAAGFVTCAAVNALVRLVRRVATRRHGLPRP